MGRILVVQKCGVMNGGRLPFAHGYDHTLLGGVTVGRVRRRPAQPFRTVLACRKLLHILRVCQLIPTTMCKTISA